jgi:hypothetical protein
VTHDREVLFVKPDYWVIVDKISGSGHHEIELLFHLTPDAEASADGQEARAAFANGAQLQIVPAIGDSFSLSIVKGSAEPIQGWVATGYNKKVPAATVVFKSKLELPATLYTALIPSVSKAVRFKMVMAPPDSAAIDAKPTARKRFSIAGEEWNDDLIFSENRQEAANTGQKSTGDGVISFSRRDKAGVVIREFSISDFQ